jgi:hypothetical protein
MYSHPYPDHRPCTGRLHAPPPGIHEEGRGMCMLHLAVQDDGFRLVKFDWDGDTHVNTIFENNES